MSLTSNAGTQFTTDSNRSCATPKTMYGQNELLLQQAIAYRYTTAFAGVEPLRLGLTTKAQYRLLYFNFNRYSRPRWNDNQRNARGRTRKAVV